MALKLNPITGQLDLVLNKAREIQYLNATSGLTATELQAAIDELAQMIADLPNPIVYKGTWNAATNTPTFSNTDTGVEGFLYQVNVAGTVDFGAGPIEFAVGDKVVNNGTQWQKWDMTDSVLSVNGDTGIVQLNAVDIPYDNTTSGLTATDTQTAIDEVYSNITLQKAYDNSTVPAILTSDANGIILQSGSGNDDNIVLAVRAEGGTTSFIVKGSGDVAAVGNLNISQGMFANSVEAPTVEISSLNPDTVVVADVDSILVSSVTTTTELSYVSGVTSSIQTQLDSKASAGPGDIPETSFTAPTSGTTANVTGATFSNAAVRSFALTLNAVGTGVYETFVIRGIQKAADWDISQESAGDTAGIIFSITSAGQIQYQSNQNLTLKFKASTLGV